MQYLIKLNRNTDISSSELILEWKGNRYNSYAILTPQEITTLEFGDFIPNDIIPILIDLASGVTANAIYDAIKYTITSINTRKSTPKKVKIIKIRKTEEIVIEISASD